MPISSVVIAGRDTGLWLAAVALAHGLAPAGVSVTAIELPSRLTASDVHAALPQLEALHARLGIAQEDVLRAAGGSFSLGQNFLLGASAPGGFFHTWGPCGRAIDGHDFLHCWLRARAAGLQVGLQGFSLAAAAALNGRMLRDDDATSAIAQSGPGCHLHASAYAAHLKSMAARRGVVIRQTMRLDTERDEDAGVAALILDGAERVAGDLFVDASGEDAVIIGGAMGVPQQPWPWDTGTDRVLSALAPAFTATPPFAEIRCGATGWTALHPTPSATGILHVFDSGLTTDAQAIEAAGAATGAVLSHIAIRPLETGIRSELWAANCVAIGDAGARLDPLHDLDLHVLQLGLAHLISLFPAGTRFTVERAEYNSVMRAHLRRLRDFQCAFHALVPGPGAFWQRGARPLSETLKHTLDTFRASAYLPPHEGETFLPDSWHCCLLGLGVRPERWPPATDRIPAPRLREEIERILALIRAKVREQPMHDACLRAIHGPVTAGRKRPHTRS
jgi:tryptophan halogenase